MDAPMLQRLRGMFGFALMTMGTLGTMAGPVHAQRAAGSCPNRPPPLGAASRPRRSCVLEPFEQARSAAGGDASGGFRRVVEAEIQQLVAEQLGVDAETLVPEVSLTDDLAADSLDLLELALVVEAHFAVALPASRVDEVRTYRDLVDLVMASTPPVPVKSRLVSARDRSAGIERVDKLTPYAMEILIEDAMRAGRGARLELAMPADTQDVQLAVIRDRLARLEGRGVVVVIRRDTAWDGGTLSANGAVG
jgi:acyl carrier protein